MYEAYFGFHEKPFSATPDPKFFYPSAKHKDALAHLRYGIRERMGFIVLTGEVGCGKTLLIRSLLAQLPDDVRRALILNPQLSAHELLQTIMDDFGLATQPEESRKSLLDRFNAFLFEQHAEGRTVIVIVDEAQDLEVDALEALRLLSNIETETTKLLQIILIGQPELSSVLDQPKVRQLRQRVTVRYHLKPLDAGETAEYIEHRLHVAGNDGSVQFTKGALQQVYYYSGGVPRLIGIVCDQALLVAFTMERRKITEAMVKEVIETREAAVPRKEERPAPRPIPVRPAAPMPASAPAPSLPPAARAEPVPVPTTPPLAPRRRRAGLRLPLALLGGLLLGGLAVYAWQQYGGGEPVARPGSAEPPRMAALELTATPTQPHPTATHTTTPVPRPTDTPHTAPIEAAPAPPTRAPHTATAVPTDTARPTDTPSPTLPPEPTSSPTLPPAEPVTLAPPVTHHVYAIPSGEAMDEVPPTSPLARFAVQAACFRSQEQASQSAQDLLRRFGETVLVVEDRTQFGDWYRVLVGAYASRQEADEILGAVHQIANYQDAFVVLNRWYDATRRERID